MCLVHGALGGVTRSRPLGVNLGKLGEGLHKDQETLGRTPHQAPEYRAH